MTTLSTVETSVLTAAPNGVAIAYRDSMPAALEDRVPVVLVHGMGGDGRTWDGFARRLTAQGRRVVVVDLRGHGRSGRAASYRFDEFADDIAGLCEHLGLGVVDLVGHSLGGHTGSLVAQRNPGLVRRLVLEEAPVPLRDGDPVPEVPSHRPTPAELWHAATSMVRSPRAVLAFDRGMTESVISQFRTPNPAWWQCLPSMTVPTLFLRGVRRGSMVDPHLLDAALELFPHGEVREVVSGHSIHRDRADDFAAEVLPFLAG